MTLDILQIEKALLRGTWVTQSKNNEQSHFLAEAVVDGRFRDALTSPSAVDLFHIRSPTLDQPLDQALKIPLATTGEEELMQLTFAVACLHAFLQVNWTGPDLDVRPLEVISLNAESPLSPNEDALNKKAIAELAYGGEPAYHLTKDATFLRLAQILLALPYNHCQTIPWWKLRTNLVHQQVLDEFVPLPTLHASIEPLKAIFSSEPDLLGRLILEQGLLEHQFSQDKSASELFVHAAKTTGLQFLLTGALGKRTRFQQTDLSQLVLLAESHLVDDDRTLKRTSDAKSDFFESSNPPKVPDTLALNDDTLLEQTEFTSSSPARTDRLSHIDASSQPPLHPLDQCILLALCLNVKNTSPSHGLTNEQMAPYVTRVITHPRNWSVHTMALLLRSRLEASRTRTAERSTLQLQALIDQMPTTDSTLSERLSYFHSIPLPSKWEMERELAMRFLSLGVVRSALEIFERLEMWEEVVKCWGSLERHDKAITIVRDLLEGRKAEADEVLSRAKLTSADRRQIHDDTREAKLWCILGDLEPEHAIDHYKHAWTLSKETSGRAMRSLGGHYFARGQFADSICCLKRAVTINPLLSRSWFILGCACMREELWEEAKNAFSRCVAIDEEDGESWNNLASMYLRMATVGEKGDESSDPDHQIDQQIDDLTAGDDIVKSIPFSNKILAFRALKHGLRFSHDNWRMWYNYMIVSMNVGELFEAARALRRVVEETSDKAGVQSVDEGVLERLVDAVTREPVNPEGAMEEGAMEGGNSTSDASNLNEGQGLLRTVLNLLEHTILPRVSSARIFRAYARLLTWQERWEEALKANLDGYRCSTAGTMEKGESNVESWREGVNEVGEIVDVLRNFGPRVDGYKWRLQGRSIVRTFIGRTRDFEDEPEWHRLTEMQEELQEE